MWSYPEWHFQLSWDVLRDDRSRPINSSPSAPNNELRELMAFFAARRGAYDSFWFDDPTDDALSSQVIGVGDGTTVDFPVIRTINQGGTDTFADLVGAVKASGFAVTVGGSGASPTLNSPYDGWLHFAAPPGNGASIVVTGGFYFRVRFLHDVTDFENFQRDLWMLRQVELVSLKP
jgi:uncharacterized protein (TIGR02217 family)